MRLAGLVAAVLAFGVVDAVVTGERAAAVHESYQEAASVMTCASWLGSHEWSA